MTIKNLVTLLHGVQRYMSLYDRKLRRDGNQFYDYEEARDALVEELEYLGVGFEEEYVKQGKRKVVYLWPVVYPPLIHDKLHPRPAPWR